MVSQIKERESNLELLRLIAMVLVLVVHASFKALDAPSTEEVLVKPISSFLRFFSESISIVCVNIFILITGWFGIHPKVVRFCALIFQVQFIGLVVYIVLILLGRTEERSLLDWLNILLCRKELWFVGAFIVLYILSPILNAFADTASRKTFRNVLISFFAIQTILGFNNPGSFFCGGYTPLSFAGLYLLARYIKLYPNRFSVFNKLYDMGIYFITALFTSLVSMLFVGIAGKSGWCLYRYLSPLVIVGSVYFFLFFTKLSFNSKFINWAASSAFAVYLLHCDPLFFESYFLSPIREWYIDQSMLVFFFYTSTLIISVFCLAIIIDKIRILLWEQIYSVYDHLINKDEYTKSV